jgi:hypothetical protein
MNYQIVGLLVVILAGLCIGFAPVPLKRMQRFQYEHWAFIAMLTGLVLIPWAITLKACPDAWGGLRAVGPSVLLKANLFSIGWGIANVLFLQCLVRIGVSLTSGIVGGMTVALGVLVPVIFKGTGAFHDAPAIGSPAGWAVLGGVGITLLGVFLAARAGMARERQLANQAKSSGSFAVGLAMAITAGFLGSGISFSFVYSQGPIVEAMKARGAGDFAANVSVWAAALLGGALVNVLYPAYLMTRNKSWFVLGQNPREVVLAVLLGTAFIAGFSLLGKGMLLLGALGASVGFGVQQSVQMLGNQAVGFAYGEWRDSSPVTMYCAVGLLILAIGILSIGNSLART